MRNEVLRIQNVTVVQDGVTLLDDFSLHIFQAEIMGIICINTNGQDYLMRLLEQNAPVQYGRVYFNERLVDSYQGSFIADNKVAVIEQKSRLIENLTVADNVYVMRKRFKKYVINSHVLEQQLDMFTHEADIELDGARLVSDLPPCERYVTELLRAVVSGAKLIVIRDISNVLSTADLMKFHSLMRYYCSKGFSFLYICSHHEEAFKVCHRMGVMRDGRMLKVLDKSQFTSENMIPFYIDEFSKIKQERVKVRSDDAILEFKDLCADDIKQLTFSIPRGQCTVVLDMDNTVINNLIAVISGYLSPISGEIFLKGKPYTQWMAKHALQNGIAIIQENPVKTMLFPEMSYIDNLCFLADKKLNPVRLNNRFVKSVEQEYESFLGQDIYASDITKLSKESLYNLVYYRVHLYRPDIAFCIQPFINADMYLRRHIIELINQLKKRGITVVMLVTNIADCLAIADRLVILSNGAFLAEYPRSDFYLFTSDSIVL